MRYRSFLPHSRLILDALVAAVLLTILSLTSSFFIQALVDSIFVLGRKPALNLLGLGMLLVTLARAGFYGLRSYLLTHLCWRINAGTVPGRYRLLPGLPLILIHNGICVTTVSAVLDSLLAVITVGIMLWLNWELTLRSLQLIPVLAGIVWLLNKPMKKHQQAAMEQTLESRFAEAWDTSFKAQLVGVYASTVSYFISGVSTLGLLWFGGHKVLSGDLTVGQLMALHTMLGTILRPMESLINANHAIQSEMIAAERIDELRDVMPERENRLEQVNNLAPF